MWSPHRSTPAPNTAPSGLQVFFSSGFLGLSPQATYPRPSGAIMRYAEDRFHSQDCRVTMTLSRVRAIRKATEPTPEESS
jgi:hypothetical protein